MDCTGTNYNSPFAIIEQFAINMAQYLLNSFFVGVDNSNLSQLSLWQPTTGQDLVHLAHSQASHTKGFMVWLVQIILKFHKGISREPLILFPHF